MGKFILFQYSRNKMEEEVHDAGGDSDDGSGSEVSGPTDYKGIELYKIFSELEAESFYGKLKFSLEGLRAEFNSMNSNFVGHAKGEAYVEKKTKVFFSLTKKIEIG
jgi:hypothetical protein